eukprot:6181635-Pleurochrysis_carterae.AAC.1
MITNEEPTNEADQLPQASETEGNQSASDITNESVLSSTTEEDEAAPYISIKKFSIADEAKVRNPGHVHTKLFTVCCWLFALFQVMNDHESLSQEKDSEEGSAPSLSFVSLRNKPHRAYCTIVESAQHQTLFCPLRAESDVPDRSPVTMFAKRSSDKAVMQPAQKRPKVKLPWISFQLPSAYMALGNKACIAIKVMLESMGFEIPSTPRIARDERGNLKLAPRRIHGLLRECDAGQVAQVVALHTRHASHV